MKSKLLLTTLLLGASCSSGAGTGALVGGGVGVGTGALISGTPQGALIGGAIGAASGAVIGAAVDSGDQHSSEQRSPESTQQSVSDDQLSIEDIKRMSQSGVADDKIISLIHSTGSVYHLTTDDIKELKEANVSQRVIDAMIQTAY